MKKTIATIAAMAMVLTAFMPIGASAQTTAELQAQINSLLTVLNQLQARLAALGGTTGTTTGSTIGGLSRYTFTGNLTVGSRGQDVTQLQMFLVARGFLTMPQGVAFGYFGTLTRSALARFQSAQGIAPAAGYFGPITRAAINNILAAIPVPGTGTTTPSTGGITTPGVEGIMSVLTDNSGLSSSVYEGQTMVPILGIRVQARRSDLAVQRITLDLGNNSTLYNKIFSRLYVTDGSNVLASTDLNSSTVLREGTNNYSITITGFNYIVPHDTDKTLVIKADVRTSIDTSLQGGSYTIALANNGVRALDGAGIDHYAPTTGTTISRSITPQQSLAESSTLTISLNSSTPNSQEMVASSGANNNEADKVTLLTFDLKATRDDVTINDLTANVVQSGSGTANASSTVYLYEGSTEIDNATPNSSGSVTFQNVDYTVPRDTTRTLSIKADIRNANSNISYITASIPANGINAQNSIGDTLTSSSIRGSALGYQIGFRNAGGQVALASKQIVTSGVPQASGENSILTATFNVTLQAVGGDLILGTVGSTTPAFNTNSFAIYRNGVIDNSISTTSLAVSFSVPTGANTAGLTNSFRVPEGNSVTLPVTIQLRGRPNGTDAAPAGLYAIGIQNINVVANGVLQQISFMAGQSDWRTNDVSFP